MSVYLIRHGIAQNFADTDFERELTTEGRIKLRDTFEVFADEIGKIKIKVYSSPLIRAVQTAEILCDFLNCEFEISDWLGYESYVDRVRKLKEDKDINYILVGHEPNISDCIYRITGKVEIISRGSIHIIKNAEIK
ncbi:histidine phosphatase family protein [Peptoniphilus sp. oral taxon 386]|uniref:SixA phosphatase family protein n=1 Tax=Peptoniphilus sp. oral taxon 386 TaxID=652713 RepID=UPI0001DA9A9B|nr:histidine phosphatase family protein [Peptoniphilus sp. oral taxon 386]EFI41973.1 putative phosphohistidine phosphatase SixA [Peptoniphilus sp. oral taxon 386 str. F0131]